MTPEDALWRLEAAYRDRDIEAAVRVKGFAFEAERMLSTLALDVSAPGNASLVSELAQTLELAYRAEIERSGFPDMSGLQTSILATEVVSPDLVALTERIDFPDGRQALEVVFVARGLDGWRVVQLPPE